MQKDNTKFPTNMLQPILNNELIECPPRIGSVMLWRDVFGGRVAENEPLAKRFSQVGFTYPGSNYDDFLDAIDTVFGRDICPFCDGTGTRIDGDKYYYCICWLLKHERHLKAQVAEFGSQWRPQSIDDLKLNHMGHDAKTNYQKWLPYLKDKWTIHPDRWLLIYGGTGGGKTHVLNHIMNAWYPWAMYVVASDFEDKLRTYMNGGQENIQRFISALQNHPMLVFDDLGIQYSTDWIAAKLDAVIEYRSREVRWWDSLMVVASNLLYRDFKAALSRNNVSRSGSRLTNETMVLRIAFNADDYRSVPK